MTAAALRVPEYAWSWLQRSRDVVQEAAARLTGDVPGPGFVERLRPEFATDPFVRDVVIGVVVDVAFNGRVPSRRPPGASWDRGLTWWAALCAGVAPAEFERRSRGEAPPQRPLFEPPPAPGADDGAAVVPSVGRRGEEADDGALGRAVRARIPDRTRLVQSLRSLLEQERDGQVPAAAVRALLEELERG